MSQGYLAAAGHLYYLGASSLLSPPENRRLQLILSATRWNAESCTRLGSKPMETTTGILGFAPKVLFSNCILHRGILALIISYAFL